VKVPDVEVEEVKVAVTLNAAQSPSEPPVGFVSVNWKLLPFCVPLVAHGSVKSYGLDPS
jgi:hypothetical protein